MKTLTLMRHAKSSWDDGVGRDFDRPLNAKGRRAAGTMGRHLRERGAHFDRLVASPARRVAETLDAFGSAYGALPDPDWRQGLYLASPEVLMEVVRGLPDGAARVLLAGHGPGLEELALHLAEPGGDARAEVERKYPTASVAELELPVDRWSHVSAGVARLVRFVRPRDLDPELGPDPD